MNSIGPFVFTALFGTPVVPAEQAELVARRGVDGTALWRTGSRGEPFQMRSLVDYPSIAVGHQMAYYYRLYQNQVAGLWLVQDGVNYAIAWGLHVNVLDVRTQRIEAVAKSTGGLNPPGLCVVEADWTMIFM